MSFCVLTHYQVKKWEETGVRPLCDYHHHISNKEAFKAELAENAYIIPGSRALVYYTSNLYVWAGRNSANYRVMQMVPIIR